ncbi:MAG TPA: AgmX/PglI C-terminal domain-containing protein [Gemmatimonadaceae bacterium]|nr:AgmX/PglI C-terminal domain-containing protein [Gemmatimonadaceae bacterium]
MTTRLILGACMLAHVAHAQLAAKPSLATPTSLRETETGSWRAGDAMVWIRVAPTGAISVYASHGYRSAFAHAVIITPEDADKWADLGDHVLAGQTAGGAVMLGDSDIALEPMRAGDSVALAVRLGGVRPDGITFLMNGQSLREVLPILRATAKASRATQSASAAPPAATPAPPAAAPTAAKTATATPATATPAAAPTAAKTATVTPATATPAPTAPTAAAPATPAPVTAAPVTAPPAAARPTTPAAAPAATPHTAAIDSPPPAVPVVLASAPAAPAAPAAPPEVAAADTPPAPAPEAEVAPATSTPAVAAAPVAPTPAPAQVAPVPVAPAPVAPVKIAKVTKPKPAPQAAETAPLRHTSTGSIAKPAAAMTITVGPTDATKLAPSTVANLVKQWQSQLDLCYSEFGLKVNPALTGSIAVRLAIRSTGDVGAATFVHHRWSGAGGTEAESCMRARVMAWMFPPASTPSAHEFTVAFAP